MKVIVPKDDVKEKVLEFRDEGGEALLMAANMDAQIIGAEYAGLMMINV